MRERVAKVRALARRRGVPTNAALPSADLEVHAPLTKGARDLLERQLLRGRALGPRPRSCQAGRVDTCRSRSVEDDRRRGPRRDGARTSSRASGSSRWIGGSREPRRQARPGRPDDLPDVAYAATLAGLGSMTPQRLQRLLRGRSAAEVFADLRCSGGLASCRDSCVLSRRRVTAAYVLPRSWMLATSSVRDGPGLVWERLAASGTTVLPAGEPGFPGPSRRRSGRAGGPVRPWGDRPARRDPVWRSWVPGRRRTTGRPSPPSFGADLSDAGVVVIISGLAAGIDAAAHEGALAPERPTPPVAVVGGGVDVVYPASSGRLWARLETAGGILSEAAPGTAPEGWRFPLRNRLVAALAHVVVVVESHKGGGALHTVTAADERGVTVLAVPGSVRSPGLRGHQCPHRRRLRRGEGRGGRAGGAGARLRGSGRTLRTLRPDTRAGRLGRHECRGGSSGGPAPDAGPQAPAAHELSDQGADRTTLAGRAFGPRVSRRRLDPVRARVRAGPGWTLAATAVTLERLATGFGSRAGLRDRGARLGSDASSGRPAAGGGLSVRLSLATGASSGRPSRGRGRLPRRRWCSCRRTVLMPARSTGSAVAASSTPCSTSATR